MKRCLKCRRNKSLTEFYRHPSMKDGHFNKCRSCVCRGTQANYRRRREYYREYERKRAQEPTRRAYQLKLNRRYRRRRQKQAGK